jgi:16S rRNA (guanine527-N7)-methyltransferase
VRLFGIRLDEAQVEQFWRFGEMLEEWNRRLNLTRIPPEEYVPLHFLDSLAAAAAHNFAESRSLIDVGTGAGFPGIPLKIAFPHLRVTLLDSTRKRLAFLDAVIQELDLDETRTLHARAEEAARNPLHRERYDAAAARAVARMDVLAEWMIPFVRVDGAALALKSGAAQDEAAESADMIRAMGGSKPEVFRLTLPGTEIERAIIRIQKVRPTPVRYSRSQIVKKSTK